MKDYMEQEFWNLLRQGDERAFSELYNTHADLLYGYGIKLCSNRETVEEAIQQVFIRFFERRHFISRPESTTAYLCRALKNTIIRLECRRRSTSLFSLDEALGKPSDNFGLKIDPQSLIDLAEEEQQRQEVLQQILDSLDGRQREIIYLRYYKGLSVQEVAEITGLKDENVYNFTSRIIRKLKEKRVWERAFILTLLSMQNWQ